MTGARHVSLVLFLTIMFLAGAVSAFELTSSAFKNGSEIPREYTCQGKDVSPALSWSGVPAKTRSFALICEDPDAPLGTWVHWVYYDIPATVSSLPAAIPKKARPAPGGTQGTSSFNDVGYGGPCPPWGTHRYFFRMYALDTVLGLEPGIKKKDLLKAMEGHVLATAELMGTYRKK